jgi:hypothetical protein
MAARALFGLSAEGLSGLDRSWRALLAVQLEGGNPRLERREHDRGVLARLSNARHASDEGCQATTHRELARSGVVFGSRVRAQRFVFCMVLRRRVVSMLLVVSVHVVAVMGTNHSRAARALLLRAQHGRCHRAPRRHLVWRSSRAGATHGWTHSIQWCVGIRCSSDKMAGAYFLVSLRCKPCAAG